MGRRQGRTPFHTAQVSKDSRWVKYLERVPRARSIRRTCRWKAATDSATDGTR